MVAMSSIPSMNDGRRGRTMMQPYPLASCTTFHIGFVQYGLRDCPSSPLWTGPQRCGSIQYTLNSEFDRSTTRERTAGTQDSGETWLIPRIRTRTNALSLEADILGMLRVRRPHEARKFLRGRITRQHRSLEGSDAAARWCQIQTRAPTPRKQSEVQLRIMCRRFFADRTMVLGDGMLDGRR